MIHRPTVVVGLSGGVDSAVSAFLLQKAGYEVHAVFMKNYEPLNELAGECPWEADLASADSVARYLQIPLHVWNFEREYRQKVLEVFLENYALGLTPNPDITCNREIKFGIFLARAKKEGYDGIATGHYTRIKRDELEKVLLLRGADLEKDQSYFLCQVPSRNLRMVHFPVGHLTKPQVRQIALRAGLPNAERPDSHGICFIGEVDVRKFLRRHLRLTPGSIMTTTGEVIGRHEGLPLFTIGQREGIGVGGSGLPMYVIGKEVKTNTLRVVRGNRHAALYRRTFFVGDITWFNQPVKEGQSISIQLRYRHPAINGVLTSTSSDFFKVELDEPQRAVTPGQIAAFYDGEVCLGGGAITYEI